MSDRAKWTRGPWGVRPELNPRYIVSESVAHKSGEPRLIAMTCGHSIGATVSDAEVLANRTLIAAAPDLAEALWRSDRISILLAEREECCARINGAGRTTSVESIILSRRRKDEIDAEVREIRASTIAALRKAGAL